MAEDILQGAKEEKSFWAKYGDTMRQSRRQLLASRRSIGRIVANNDGKRVAALEAMLKTKSDALEQMEMAVRHHEKDYASLRKAFEEAQAAATQRERRMRREVDEALSSAAEVKKRLLAEDERRRVRRGKSSVSVEQALEEAAKVIGADAVREIEKELQVRRGRVAPAQH